MMKMTEPIVSLMIKGALIITAWFFAQVKPMAEYGIGQAFDQLFSIGLLALFLVYMIYENKRKDRKQEASSEAYLSLLQQNTEAIQQFSESNKDVAKSVERSALANEKAIENMVKAIEKIEAKVV